MKGLNHPTGGNAGFAFRLVFQCHWPGAPQPGRERGFLNTLRLKLVFGPLRIAGFGMALFCALPATLRADRGPLSPERLAQESELIISGQVLSLKVGTERAHVERGFGNYDWAIDLNIRVQSIEKGRLDGSDSIVVRCFRLKSRKSAFECLTPSGNHPIPDVGAKVRAHLYRRGGVWRVVFPNGLTALPGQERLLDGDAVEALRSRFTYWLPFELWIFIALIGALLLPILVIRRLRRSRPVVSGRALPLKNAP